MQYLRLGNLYLSAGDGPNSFEESQSFTFAAHDMATGKPILQAIGSALKQISLAISLRAARGHDVAGTIRALEVMLHSGEPQKFVFADGVYVGEYVITEKGVSITRTTTAGTIVEADVSITLQEWEDRVIITNRASEAKPKTEAASRKIKVTK